MRVSTNDTLSVKDEGVHFQSIFDLSVSVMQAGVTCTSFSNDTA